jgi:hypothetical protein
MNRPARLIIPIWGDAYAHKLVTITLPAILAPGNLPALSALLDVEIVLVTETRLFDLIRSSPSFQLAGQFAKTRLVAIDDLLTDLPGDYGVVLTYALFRGLADLGDRLTETYLLFLNADFIIADGSLNHVGKLISAGARVIHAPSFRVVLEDVSPMLQAQIDPARPVLAMKPRELVKLALEHKHLTVKARTVNQKLYHQWRMDQFYWYIDESTLIGYQWPIALVAIRPERAVSEPVTVWDYGFIPEAAPTATRHFITDSDDFFMIETQKRMTGEELVRVGWISVEDIARDLSVWTTKEQRECGDQLLTIHAGEIPSDTPGVVAESVRYMSEIKRRLDPVPQPHRNHAMLARWFEGAKVRMKEQRVPAQSTREGLRTKVVRTVARALEGLYRWVFGEIPDVTRFHPLWIDVHDVAATLDQWKSEGRKLLWLSSVDSLFRRRLSDRVDTTSILIGSEAISADASYDCCLCELAFDDLPRLRELYARVRPSLQDGATMIVHVFNRNHRTIAAADTSLCEIAFPDTDISELRFLGTRTSSGLQLVFLKLIGSLSRSRVVHGLAVWCALTILAPLVWLANTGATMRDKSKFSPTWSTLLVAIRVKKQDGTQLHGRQ